MSSTATSSGVMLREIFAKRSPSSLVCTLMFLSGACSLIVETILFRLLSYVFGNTAYAASTVLAVFMGGLAIGSAVFGKWCSRRPRSLLPYGVLELSVAAYSLLLPVVMFATTKGYVLICHSLGLRAGHLIPVQIAFAAVVAAFPAFLMGGTLPAVAHFLSTKTEFEITIDKVYAANTFGAAAGALLAGYVLIPWIGILGTLFVAAGIGVFIFSTVKFVDSRENQVSRYDSKPRSQNSRGWLYLYLPFAFLSGAITLAFEVVWNHALGFLIGNTVYSFVVMLFTILFGLAAGSAFVAKRISNPERWQPSLVLAQALTGVIVLVSLPLWQYLPSLFTRPGLVVNIDLAVIAIVLIGRLAWLAARRAEGRDSGRWYRRNEGFLIIAAALLSFLAINLAERSQTTAFLLGDFFRFVCAFAVLIVPSFLLGIAFPLLLNLCSQGREKSAQIGMVYSVNTVGTVTGSLLAGFAMLPILGSFRSIRALALASFATSLAMIFVLTQRSRRQLLQATVVLVAGIGLYLLIPSWDAKRINNGGYAYFSDQPWSDGHIRFMEEDVQSGMTTVIEANGTRFLLSNAKFQGDNKEQVGDQMRFALIPMIFAHRTERALVIGLGTGNTLRTLADFPFKKIDVVEISPGVVQAARSWFHDVNSGVFDSDPRITLTEADARNFLLLSKDKYDLITIEVSSLWMSGQADLYNKEFYELVNQHLSPGGVLQQWVAIHHLRQKEFFVILNTAAGVFPHMALFRGSDHTFLVASRAALEIDSDMLASFNGIPAVRRDLNLLGGGEMTDLLREMCLNEASMPQALDKLAADNSVQRDLISSDLFPRLEYGAPKGLLSGVDTFSANTAFLDGFRPVIEAAPHRK